MLCIKRSFLLEKFYYNCSSITFLLILTLIMCMFLCRVVVIPFYWLIGNIYLFISSHHQLPTLFSPPVFCFHQMQEINSFSCSTLPPHTFYSRAHTYPRLFTLQNWSVIIPENQVLNCPFLLITQTYTQTCIDPHTKHIHTENLTQKKSNRSLKSPTPLSLYYSRA